MLKKIRSLTDQYAIPAALIVFAVVKLLLLGLGKLFSFLPVSLEMEYLSETILIIVPIAIVCFFGFARTFKTGSFIRGLICCLPFVVLQLIMLAVVLTDALRDPEANWRSWYVIVLGIYSTIGIGIREECIYRATIQNIIAKKHGDSVKGIWLTLILSALIFGLTHATNIFFGVNPLAVLNQIMSATVVGLLFGAVYLRSGNLWVLVLVHTLTDTVGLMGSIFFRGGNDVEDMSQLTFSWRGMVLDLFYVALVVFLLRPSKCKQICESFCFADKASKGESEPESDEEPV